MRQHRIKLKALLLLIIQAYIFYNQASAQGVVWGFGVGPNNHFSDVAQTPVLANTRVGGKLFINKYLSNYLIWRNTLSINYLQGKDSNTDDPFQNNRNFSFTTLATDLSTGVEYNFLPFRKDARDRNNFTPYAFLSLGVGHFNWLEDASPQTGGNNYRPSRFAVVVPFGVGFKKKIARKVDFGMEINVTKSFSDHLEGFVPPESMPNPNPRGFYDTETNDTYFQLNFFLAFHFVEVVCPEPYNTWNKPKK